MTKIKHSEKIRAEARYLAQTGLKPQQISAQLNVARSTICYWVSTQYREWHSGYRKNYYEDHKSFILEQGALYRKKNAEKIREQKMVYRRKNASRIAAAKKAAYQRNKAVINQKKKQYYIQNKETVLAQQREYAKRTAADRAVYLKNYQRNNKTRCNENKRRWARHNPDKLKARLALRRARKLQATPPWLSDEQKRVCQAIYKSATDLQRQEGVHYHVDHIQPLVGKAWYSGEYVQVSCGLHVPWNLQAIPAHENLKKSCKLQP